MKTLNDELNQAFLESGFSSFAPLVLGNGIMNPRILLIGEAPGEQEVLQGRPFVGKAGKNLSEFLEVVGLEREEVYITNVVKFRPTKCSKAGRIVNRPPTPKEIAFFLPYLRKEVRLLNPRIVVTLGNVALQAFMQGTIGDHHGCLQKLISDGTEIRLFPLYHPASVIYNPALKQVYQADLQILKKILETV